MKKEGLVSDLKHHNKGSVPNFIFSRAFQQSTHLSFSQTFSCVGIYTALPFPVSSFMYQNVKSVSNFLALFHKGRFQIRYATQHSTIVQQGLADY